MPITTELFVQEYVPTPVAVKFITGVIQVSVVVAGGIIAAEGGVLF